VNVDRQNDKAFVDISVINPVDEASFLETVAAPGGPEFQQHDLAFDRVIVEPLAAGGGGIESWSGFLGLGFAGGRPGNRAEKRRYQKAYDGWAQNWC